MKIIKTFRYRLEPNIDQRIKFAQFAGTRRFLFNRSLAKSIETYQNTKKYISYKDLANELPELKKQEETIWLNDIHSQVLQQALKDHESAFDHFFRRIKKKEKPGFPRFKKKGDNDSFRYPQGIKVKDNKVYLPKIGWVSYINSRPLEGTIKQTTIKLEGEYWYVTFTCELEKHISTVAINENKAVGIDLGITHAATLSDGRKIDNPRHLKKAEKKLKREQRKLSKKEKGSNNFKKQKCKVRKCHIRIKNCRKDFLHKATTDIVKNHDVISVESLNISGMLKNHKLAKAIADVSWYLFLSMIEYKCAWNGKHFVKIDPFFPSTKTCSSCKGQQVIPLSMRTYECKSCGFVLDRDFNASINIRAAGLAVLNACGGMSTSSPSETRITVL